MLTHKLFIKQSNSQTAYRTSKSSGVAQNSVIRFVYNFLQPNLDDQNQLEALAPNIQYRQNCLKLHEFGKLFHNFSKNCLNTSTICRSGKSAFVIFLENSRVWVPLIDMHYAHSAYSLTPTCVTHLLFTSSNKLHIIFHLYTYFW